ncbi:autophagy protein atg9, partial [Coemansia spiralis]
MDGSGTDENAWLGQGLSPRAPASGASAASGSPAAHTRGLTSTLSGRRTRHEQASAGTGSAAASDTSGQQVAAQSPRAAWRTQERRDMHSFRGLDSDDESGQPPASLLVELPPLAAGNGSDTRGSEQASVLLESHAHDGRTGGFVRRAAQAVQAHIQEAAAGLPQLGGTMPAAAPPHRRARGGQRRQRQQQQQQQRPTYRERALRAWRDVRHQDDFFCRVYGYYAGKGALTIMVSRVLQLATLAFVVVLSTFVFGCIDHAKVREQKSLAAVVIPQCTRRLSWPASLALWSFAAFWAAQVARTAMDVPPLLEMRAFFEEVLGVPPADMGTVAWHEVVGRMIRLRDAEIR